MARLSRHPKALPFLFLTEMWERFGFYIVQGLLVLYMTEYFGFSDTESYTILGVFTALVYISPLVGGYLASNLFGFTTTIIWGGIFLVIGYAMLALPYAKPLLYPALSVIIVGNGLFKPNISSLLGMQYTTDDPRRDAGFTIFYIGINIGAFLAGISAGYIKEYFGWRTSFALASIGLVIGLLTFSYGLAYLKKTPAKAKLKSAQKYQLALYTLLTILGVSFLLKIHGLSNWLLPAVGVILFFLLMILIVQQPPKYRNRMIILSILIISSIIFWMLMLQLFYSANLFVERLVDKDYFGFHLSTTVFWGSESIFIILLGPLFAFIWDRLGARNKNPSPLGKFAFGIFFAGVGFLILGLSTLLPSAKELVNPLWVFLSYMLITIGELLISPIGLSAVTLLSPPNLVGLMMGVWFVATGFGGIFAGMIANLASVPSTVMTSSEKLAIYQSAFLDYAYFAFMIAIILFFVGLAMKKTLASIRFID